MSSPTRKPNHLASEKSPYLQQHAFNPVDWYAWGDEAFARARTEQKPIFLSIGYSTCHWCHVMERESFEDDTVAAYLREHFISIKVDREERPDVDAIYMAAVQAMSGQGGWPMTVFLTPDLDPFFGSTYFPPEPKFGRPSFLQLIQKISEMWTNDHASLIESSKALTDAIKGGDKTGAGQELLSKDVVDHCYTYFDRSYDPHEGVWGNAPKFPRPVQFEFLFNYYFNYKVERAKEMALFTLRKMANGGMRDQLAGGFHRYSVDMYWRVPHFEKMLYDNAQLAHAYVDAYQISKDQFFADVASDTIDYVLRDMTSPEGAFYSAEDADSEGEEGTFYVWTSQEIRDMLDPFDAKLALYYYGFAPQGNFEHGKNVLHVSHTIAEAASAFEVSEDEIRASLTRARKILHEARAKRQRPHLDDKILTSWNGLMIGAMARTGAVLNKPEYVSAAVTAGDAIWDKLRKPGELLHRYRDGEAKYPGYLETYAFYIRGLLDLYGATLDTKWLLRAVELQK
ncbi:MAG TPA: thioredoxin domain-containing protein, partial [Candidatus Kapabacteria bacterium]|nr:thioredoxin domain-containing protein [Candidatus Kapabacteria bacterium]